MSEPIALTERERAVFARVSRSIYRAANELGADDIVIHETMFQIGQVFERMWRDDAAAAESASPPRVPGASAQPGREGVESGPGQPTDILARLERTAGHYDDAEAREAAVEIRRLRAARDECERQLQAQFNETAKALEEGRRAGIEAAAQWHDEQTLRYFRYQTNRDNDIAKIHRAAADAIRALADKPAPDAARKGG